jgi:hypothetical protein
LAYFADPITGLSGGPIHHDNFLWDKYKATQALENNEPDTLFVCGSSRNRDDFLPYFKTVFNLKIDDETMRRRLVERTNNDFGKKPEVMQLMLELNRKGDKPARAIDINANQPLTQVVDDILRYCGLELKS